MQIEKAYLFARQISAGGTPPMPVEVYYENGKFNPLYVPSSLDVVNNKIEGVGNYYDTPDYLEFMNENSDHFDDGTTFYIYHMETDGTPTIEDCLEYNSLTFANDGIVYRYFKHPSDRVIIRVILPIVGDIINNYDYLFVEYETQAGYSESHSKGYAFPLVRSSDSVDNSMDFGYNDEFNIQGSPIYGDWRELRDYVQYGTQFLFLSFWSSGDWSIDEDVFTLKVKKIYGSNTLPE